MEHRQAWPTTHAQAQARVATDEWRCGYKGASVGVAAARLASDKWTHDEEFMTHEARKTTYSLGFVDLLVRQAHYD